MNVAAFKSFETAGKTDDSSLTDFEPVNILIVDDLPEKIFVYRAILEELHQNLIIAHSGEEALKLVLKHEFAVILLDVNMPGMDGFETASLIRKRKKSSKTPIIFLTAFNDDMNIAQGYASGAVDYLPTPIVPEVLRAKIRVFIELFQMRQQAAAQAGERAKREAAEESDRRKDEFLATLAHELRNPLAPLSNALHLLQMPEPKPEIVKSAYQIMNRQLQNMVRLVDDLLDVSRITRGKIVMRFEYIELQKAMENALETSRSMVEERGHSITLSMPDKPIIVYADMVRLSQVFSNLLNNACKYTNPGGSIEITVKAENSEVCVCIRDTGIGISEDNISVIFDLFKQVDSSLTRSQGGLGIGLTLVRSLLEMQKGTVEAFSEGLNKGSSFIVRLPISWEKSVKGKEKISASAINPNVGKILIVDDNEASAQTLAWMVEMLGYETSLAFNGPQAIQTAQSFHPHIILLDLGLPEMSGYEVCKIMRQSPSFKNTVFVAQTGWGQIKHRRQSKEAGFDYHLVKPISLSSLQEILDSLEMRKEPS